MEWQTYTNLYFEGGGVKGYAYPAALGVLEDKKVIRQTDVQACAGSSAGAGAAFLYASKATPEEITKLIDIDFSIFLDDSVGYFRDLMRLKNDWGFYEGEELTKWLKSLVKDVAGSKNITFKELNRKFGTKLYLTAFNVNMAALFWFSCVDTPDAPVWLGIRASMSIPGVFVPVKYNDYYLTDGGWMSNLPDLPGGHGELGFRLQSLKDTQAVRQIESFFDFLNAHIDGHMKQQERLHISDNLWDNMVNIKTGTIGATDFNLTGAQKAYLDLAGSIAAHQFIKKKNDEYQASKKGPSTE